MTVHTSALAVDRSFPDRTSMHSPVHKICTDEVANVRITARLSFYPAFKKQLVEVTYAAVSAADITAIACWTNALAVSPAANYALCS